MPVLDRDDALTAGELADLLDAALESGDEQLLAELARHAVARLAGMDAARPVGGSYYVFRTLRQLDVDGALEPAARRGGGHVTIRPSTRRCGATSWSPGGTG